jgi:peptidoglycan/LPS O-acetylase OafA/YrhL
MQIIEEYKNRNFPADLLKAIAIFGVVFVHGNGLFGCSSFFSEIMTWMFRIGVPCFIVLWAYFFAKSYFAKTKEQKKFTSKTDF